MATITFTIDNGKIERIKDALKGLYPIPQVNNGTEEEPVWENEFTDNDWAKECTRRWIVKQVARCEQKIAHDACTYLEEDDLVS